MIYTHHNDHIFAHCFHALEAVLWRRGFHHPLIRRLLVVQIVFVILCFMVGLIALKWSMHGISFAMGVTIFAHIFWGISGQVLGFSLAQSAKGQRGQLVLLLFSSSIRLLIAAFVLYVAFVVLKASALMLVCGVTASMVLALATFARIHFKRA